MTELAYLLIQIRDPEDNIRFHEITDFAAALSCSPESITVHDLLREPITPETVANFDCVLIGGSGKYSAAGEGEWLERSMTSLRCLHDSGIPTFASCWGHQAIARAMGGRVERVDEFAEVGTIDLQLTEAAASDPVFGGLSEPLPGQVGHEDTVTELPPNTTLLARSEKCPVHAYRFDDAPIYCTQFHPELTREGLIRRIDAYPEYIERISGMNMDEFKRSTSESPESNQLVARFVASFVSSIDR